MKLKKNQRENKMRAKKGEKIITFHTMASNNTIIFNNLFKPITKSAD